MAFDAKQYLINLKGKQYLEVKYRLMWFRDAHPTGRIDVELIPANIPVFRATIIDGEGRVLASGHGSANAQGKNPVWSGREIEKAETAAIGRALAHAGFGTQFADDDEGDHLADSPVERKPAVVKQAEKLGGKATKQAPTMTRHQFVQAMETIGVKPEEISDYLKEIDVEGGTEYARIWADVEAYRLEQVA